MLAIVYAIIVCVVFGINLILSGIVNTMRAHERKLAASGGAVAQFTPFLPFRQLVEVCNPPFKSRKIKHPRGFAMTLIDESGLPGGSKQRALSRLLSTLPQDELVYAGPAIGYAQVALAYCTKLCGKTATIFVDEPERHMPPLSRIARVYGANIVYFTQPPQQMKPLHWVESCAREYVEKKAHSRVLIPFGMRDSLMLQLYTQSFEPLKRLPEPARIWTVAGSALIANTLHRTFPSAKLMVVQVGMQIWPDLLEGIDHELFVSPYKFREETKSNPPYNTPLNYDGKLWDFVLEHGREGDYIWNTAGAPAHADDVQATLAEVGRLLRDSAEGIQRLIQEKIGSPMPRARDVMMEKKVMFSNIRALAQAMPASAEVVLNFHDEYTRSIGLSNHYTEDARMRCISSRGEGISPAEFWKRHTKEVILASVRLGSIAKPDWINGMYEAGANECGMFIPIILTNIIKRFCPRDATVLDPSMGWGDRLIAALAMKVSRYVGFDPNLDLHDGYRAIARDFAESTATSFHACRFEKKTLGPDESLFDLVMTSPPFYEQEIYEHTETDIQKPYSQWVDDMYRPYLTDAAACVKPGGHIGIYIDNTRAGPMADTTREILSSCELTYVECLKYVSLSTDLNDIETRGHPRSCWIYRK